MEDQQQPPPPAAKSVDRWLTPGVAGVGGASLFSDTGHEMVTSLLPTFLTVTLGAGPATLGAIDGVADALTGLSKLAAGRWPRIRRGALDWPPVAISAPPRPPP